MSSIHNRGEVSSLLIILSSTFLVYTYRKRYDFIGGALCGFLAMGIAALSGSGCESNSSCHGNGGITM